MDMGEDMAKHLAELTRQHQLALEHARRDPDDETARHDLEQAQHAMNVAWLAYTVQP